MSPFNSTQAPSSSPTFANVNNQNTNLLSSKRTADNLLNSKRQRLSQSHPAQQRGSRSPNTAVFETNGYNDLINGWANKPKNVEYFTNHSSSLSEASANLGIPLDQTNSSSKSNNWTSNNNTQPDQESSDFSSSNNKPINSSSSPYFNSYTNESISNGHSVQSSSHNGYNGCMRNLEVSNHNANSVKKKSDSNSDKLNQSNCLMVSSNLNGSAFSSPTSSPDSGTGSNDGSLSTTSSKSLSSIPGELPDYAM